MQALCVGITKKTGPRIHYLTVALFIKLEIHSVIAFLVVSCCVVYKIIIYLKTNEQISKNQITSHFYVNSLREISFVFNDFLWSICYTNFNQAKLSNIVVVSLHFCIFFCLTSYLKGHSIKEILISYHFLGSCQKNSFIRFAYVLEAVVKSTIFGKKNFNDF